MGVRRLLAATLLLTILITGACSSSDDSDSATTSSAAGSGNNGTGGGGGGDGGGDSREANPDASSTIEVVSVRRMKGAMDKLADAYESENPDVGVQITYADLPDLASTLADSEAAVVVNEATEMSEIGDIDDEPVDLGSDPMQIVVPEGNPADVQDVSVFGEDEVVSGICAPGTPCGGGAEEVFAAADLDAHPDEVFDRGDELLAQVRSSDLDAGLLRRSQGANIKKPNWEVVALPDDLSVAIDFQVALVSADSDAESFITWLTESDAANEILVARGLAAG